MPDKRRKSKRRSTRRLSPRYLQIVLIGLGLALFFTAGGFTFAATQETHDSFCSSCHTQPESTFYQRSLAAQSIDLASFHKTKNTRCIDCHSGNGIFGRMSAELLGAHNALAWYTRTAVQPAPLTNPIGDNNCLKCHQDVEAQQADMNNHFHVFLIRWQAVDPNAGRCVSCHTGHVTGSSANARFMDDATTQQVCDACHQAIRG